LTEGVENNASARSPSLTSTSRDLDLWFPGTQNWSFNPLAAWTTCTILQQSRFISSQNVVLTKS